MNPRLTPLLLASLCLAAATAAAHSPSPSPSEAPISSISSPELSPSESPLSAMSPFSVAHPGSFDDAPALFDELPTSMVDMNTEINDGGADPIVSRVCDSTDHPSLCLSTVVPHLHSGGGANLESILRVSVESSSSYAKKALGVVKKLAHSEESTPAVKSTLRDCKNSYDTAIENFAKTMDAFPTNDLGTMRSVLSATITFIGDCEDGFSRLRSKSPVAAYAETLTDMTSNCLAIVSQMMTSPY